MKWGEKHPERQTEATSAENNDVSRQELVAGTTGATEAHARIGTIDNIATGQRMGINRTTASVLSENNC